MWKQPQTLFCVWVSLRRVVVQLHESNTAAGVRPLHSCHQIRVVPPHECGRFALNSWFPCRTNIPSTIQVFQAITITYERFFDVLTWQVADHEARLASQLKTAEVLAAEMGRSLGLEPGAGAPVVL